MSDFKDKTGVPIKVGDFIAYGHAMGRSAGLRFGKVLALKKRERRYQSDPGASITVIGVEDDWSHNAPKLCSRVGTLQYPERTIVLDRIPDPHYTLLSEFKWP